MHLNSLPRSVLALLALAICAPAPAIAQRDDNSDWRATRAELQAEASLLERAATSPAYGPGTQGRARSRLAAVRQRLAEGDFNVGERLLVDVRGTGLTLTDTLVVQDSLYVNIPNVRRVSLRGVLRSELELVVANEVREVVRGATVRAAPMMRLVVVGEVARPGFVSVPSETLVDQLVTAAGGLSSTAELRKARLLRGDAVLYDTPELLRAVADGRSLAGLRLRDGDVLEFPQRTPPWNRENTVQIVLFLIGPVITGLLLR